MPKVLGFTDRLCEEATMKALMMRVVLGEVLLVFFLFGPAVLAAEVQSPEEVLRALVKANADRDLSTMARLMAHDADIVSYTIGGRKYVGWPQLERDMLEEFQMVARLEMPITALKVWTRGEIAWFAMELDYIRYVGNDPSQRRMVLPLRETGVPRPPDRKRGPFGPARNLPGGGKPLSGRIVPSPKEPPYLPRVAPP